MKNFKLKAEDIKPLKTGMGGCIATDRITVDGYPVNFMYRARPVNPQDSGWCFFSGINEDAEYMDNPDNRTIFDVNSIANYDESIIPLLDAPIGSVFERDESGKFVEVHDFIIPGMNEAPTITEAMQQEAATKPGGYVYCIDPSYAKDGPNGAIPREGIIGAYPVDQNGIIIPKFSFNPHYVKPA
ncbi:MAG: DUF2185 domain-containing protein [Candidatus Microsaccharimonas sp.]